MDIYRNSFINTRDRDDKLQSLRSCGVLIFLIVGGFFSLPLCFWLLLLSRSVLFFYQSFTSGVRYDITCYDSSLLYLSHLHVVYGNRTHTGLSFCWYFSLSLSLPSPLSLPFFIFVVWVLGWNSTFCSTYCHALDSLSISIPLQSNDVVIISYQISVPLFVSFFFFFLFFFFFFTRQLYLARVLLLVF